MYLSVLMNYTNMEGSGFSCQNCAKFKTSLFSFCDTDELIDVNYLKVCTHIPRGGVLFDEGQMPDYLYCVKHGQIKLSKKAPNNRHFITRIATGGDLVGHRAVLINIPYSATATAIEDTAVCKIPLEIVWQIFNNNPRFRDGAIRMLYQNLENTENKLTDVAYKPVLGRIAEALLSFQAFEEDEEVTTKTRKGVFEINRKDLASMTGTVKETVIRSIKELKNEGVLDTSGSKIIILDQERLVEISRLYD